MDKIASLFANDITRQIEEVIKVDQTDDDIIAAEIDEYVVTDAIKKHFVRGPGTVSGDSAKAARRDRDLGLRLLRFRQIELRQGARPRDRGSRHPGHAGCARLPHAQVTRSSTSS